MNQLQQIPAGWKHQKVELIAPLQRGYDLPISKIQSGKYPVVFSNGTLKTHNDFKAKGPGVVTGRSGTIGKVHFIKEDYWPHNTALWVTDFKGNSPKYILYFYKNLNLEKFGSGSGVPTLNRNDVHAYTTAIPPLPEQEKIVEVIEAWDSYLEKLTNAIELKRKLKSGLMQILLTGKIRLQGFKGKWSRIKLRDACDVKGEYGINAASVDYDENLPTYLRITDIDENGYFISSKKKSVSNTGYKKFILAAGDIVFARTGATVGKSYLYNPNDGELVFAGFLIRFHPKKEILFPYFLKAYTDTKPYWNWVKTNSSRSGQPGINGVEYGQLVLTIPTIEEQIAIANILITADRDIEALEKKKMLVEQQKKFLLNNLITGKIRLPEFNHHFVDVNKTLET